MCSPVRYSPGSRTRFRGASSSSPAPNSVPPRLPPLSYAFASPPQVFPRIKDSVQGGVLIFARSYYDFVRLRNFLRAQSASFASLCEYTKQSDISRGRAWFFHGKRQFLLYTERAHFYHRYRIRGIKDLVFYSLPEFPNYYAEVGSVLGDHLAHCLPEMSRCDMLRSRCRGSFVAEKVWLYWCLGSVRLAGKVCL